VDDKAPRGEYTVVIAGHGANLRGHGEAAEADEDGE